MSQQQLDVFWSGPHDWPEVRQKTALDNLSGVYMWTVESEIGFVVYGFGRTSRPVSKRLSEHRREMHRGKYTMFDLDAMKQGNRKEIWHGLWAGHDSDERKADFARRTGELQEVARQQMAACKIFVAEVSDVRLQHRMEAALMHALYAAPQPFCDLPDRGGFLAARREDEPSIVMSNRSDERFRNLPEIVVV